VITLSLCTLYASTPHTAAVSIAIYFHHRAHSYTARPRAFFIAAATAAAAFCIIELAGRLTFIIAYVRMLVISLRFIQNVCQEHIKSNACNCYVFLTRFVVEMLLCWHTSSRVITCLTIREAAWYIISVMSVCLSVCRTITFESLDVED